MIPIAISRDDFEKLPLVYRAIAKVLSEDGQVLITDGQEESCSRSTALPTSCREENRVHIRTGVNK